MDVIKEDVRLGKEITVRQNGEKRVTVSGHASVRITYFTNLGLESFFRGGETSTFSIEQYPTCVFVYASIAWKISHPYFLHFSSPVIRYKYHNDSIVYTTERKTQPPIHQQTSPPHCLCPQ